MPAAGKATLGASAVGLLAPGPVPRNRLQVTPVAPAAVPRQVMCGGFSGLSSPKGAVRSARAAQGGKQSGRNPVLCQAQPPGGQPARRGKVEIQRDGGNYRYVYLHGWRSSPFSMKAQYFKDVLESFGTELTVPDLNGEGENFAKYTVSRSVEMLEGIVADKAAKGDKRPLRLIGSSAGALACAVYASKHPVDRMFLLAPAFDFARALETVAGYEGLMDWQADGVLDVDGVQVPYTLMEDAQKLDRYPFVRCPTYVVHGHEDDVCDVENSLNWVRMASVNMRGVGDTLEEAGERRLLEVDDDHSLIASIKFIKEKMMMWFDFSGITDGAYEQPNDDVIEAIEVARKEEVQRITTTVPEFFARMKKQQEEAEKQAEEEEEEEKKKGK